MGNIEISPFDVSRLTFDVSRFTYLRSMVIKQQDNGKLGSFYVEENSKWTAELAYTWRGKNLISIDHTEVDPELEGKGVGSSLVEHAVEYARANGIKFILYCPFAQTVFKRKPEYRDVLSEKS